MKETQNGIQINPRHKKGVPKNDVIYVKKISKSFNLIILKDICMIRKVVLLLVGYNRISPQDYLVSLTGHNNFKLIESERYQINQLFNRVVYT